MRRLHLITFDAPFELQHACKHLNANGDRVYAYFFCLRNSLSRNCMDMRCAENIKTKRYDWIMFFDLKRTERKAQLY